jgi:hypothetical protein
MEFLARQPDDVRRHLSRAAREIPRLRRPDSLLALVLRYESTLPSAAIPDLHRRVAARARVFDTRLLALLAGDVHALDLAAHNPRLGAPNAEWLALHCIAHLLPARCMEEWDASRAHRTVLRSLIANQGLNAQGLAAQLLYREACAGTGEHVHLAQQALGLYLHFPDVPRRHLERLAALWCEHEWGSMQLQQYRERSS